MAWIGGVWNGQISGPEIDFSGPEILKFTFQGLKSPAKALVCWLEAEIL